MERVEAAEKVTPISPDVIHLYDRLAPEMGFREYWYPICLAKEVGVRPLAARPLGTPVALMRRNGKLYAVADECPHRGTPLSLGRYEFPGTNTITCCYHGFTYDLTNGNCVGALTDGPGSPIVGKMRVRTYPVAECQGIVWIWTGEGRPVALEEDVPIGMQRATVVRVVRRNVYGNWRWHIENPGMGHAFMLHRPTLYVLLRRFASYAKTCTPKLAVEGEDGEWLLDLGEVGWEAEYPNLGKWPRHGGLRERIIHDSYSPILGVTTKVSLRLPGITRVPHFPINDAMYYEWYVQSDPDHYLYFQVCCGYPQSLAERASFLLRYYAWGRPTGMIWFNNQDANMVGRSHDFAKRHGGWNPPSRLCRADAYQIAWRDYAVKRARGVGIAAGTPIAQAANGLAEAGG
jgi:phenylpropionate dioxygenase-like ring-hydroxylating dioxygenase large terminal subunit